MSWVSGITLQFTVAEDRPTDKSPYDLVLKINEWMDNKNRRETFRCVTEYYGGGKHPQVEVFGMGCNYFLENEFAEFVIGLPWKYPEAVVLLINPEDGVTRVFRPNPTRWGH